MNHFPSQQFSENRKELDGPFRHFKERLLPEHYPFVMVDATYLKVLEEQRVKSKALFLAFRI